jgi:exopolysaccharide production repressor protein
MSFPLFLRGLVGALLVFALATYLITGSIWYTIVQTVICAVLVQIGYFAAVLFLVWRSGAAQKDDAGTPKGEAAQGLAKDEKPAGEVARLPGVRRSGHP